jgi:hypothetical protein
MGVPPENVIDIAVSGDDIFSGENHAKVKSAI